MAKTIKTIFKAVKSAGEGKAPLPNATGSDPQQDLETLHKQWWQMIEATPHAISVVDAAGGIILAVNAAFERLVAGAKEDLFGLPMDSLVTEQGRERMAQLTEALLVGKQGEMEGISLQSQDGETIDCNVEGRLVLFRGRQALQLSIRQPAHAHPSAGISDRAAAFFRDLSQTLPLLLDFDQVLDRILERFAQAMEFHAFALSLMEGLELKRVTLYTSQNPSSRFLSDVQERLMEAMLHLGVEVIPTKLQHSIRERPWITAGGEKPIGSELILPIPVGGSRGVHGLGGLFHQEPQFFRGEETALFSTFVGGIASSYMVYQAYREIEAQSYTDPLTGLANRRKLLVELERLAKSLRKEDLRLSLIMIDIDHFKQLNDRYGHKVGDEVLRQLADYLRHGLREYDLVTRYGGEEFLILLPRTDLMAASEIAERIRADVESLKIWVPPGKIPGAPDAVVRITVSLGIGSVRQKEEPEVVIHRVDEALYRAKQEGRNRISLET